MASPSLPPLSAIRCFEAAARHQSFTRAAAELGMTQAAVSYQIKLLEERVGGPLFRRGARGVTLTETGRKLAPAITQSFAQLRAAFAELSQTAETRLTITALQTLATNWLVPRLGAFEVAHPDISVTLDTTNEMVDLLQGEADIGLRSGHGEWPGLAAHGLFPAAFTPLLSPRLAERLPKTAKPADILDLPLIDPHDPWWKDWFTEAGVTTEDLSARRGIRVDNQGVAGRAALSGQGVGILMPRFFRDELASGLLIQPFPLRYESALHYWLVYPEARKRSRKVRAFRDWILGEVAAEDQAASRPGSKARSRRRNHAGA